MSIYMSIYVYVYMRIYNFLIIPIDTFKNII